MPSSALPGSHHRGLKGRGFGAPTPTFLHQLPVGVRAAHDQQQCQEHKSQDDAHHGACAQACWVWVLAWGRQRGQGGPAWGIRTVGSEGGCWRPPPPPDLAPCSNSPAWLERSYTPASTRLSNSLLPVHLATTYHPAIIGHSCYQLFNVLHFASCL